MSGDIRCDGQRVHVTCMFFTSGVTEVSRSSLEKLCEFGVVKEATEEALREDLGNAS